MSAQPLRLSSILGEAWPEPLVTQVAACVEVGGALRVLKITKETPRSRVDFLVLNACRAWADVIVTSGRNLRLEGGLSYDLAQLGADRELVDSWCSDRPPADVAYLTSGRDIPLRHPAIDTLRKSLFVTSREGGRRLLDQSREQDVGREVDLLTLDEVGPREAVVALQQRNYRRVSIELGPSTAGELHRAPSCVGQLLLSTFLEQSPPELVGGSLLERSELEQRFRLTNGVELPQESGRWRFERWIASDQPLGIG